MVVRLESQHLEVRGSLPKESWPDCELQVQQKALHQYIQGDEPSGKIPPDFNL